MHKPAYALKALVLSLVLAPVLYGCGPGFPIMTSAQEELLTNVDTLKRDSADMKKRLSALEGSGGLEELRYSLAATNNRIDELRREFSFVQGSVESSDHDKAQTREDISSISTNIDQIERRLSGLEKTAAATSEGHKALEDTFATERKKAQAEAASASAGAAALDERLASLDRRMLQVEKRLADLESAVSAKKAAAAETPDKAYERGLKLLKEKDYTGAQKALESFLAKYPSHKLADHAQYWLGEIHYAKGDWAKAILEFDKVIKNYPGGGKVAAAMLKQGFSFDQLGSTNEARVLLKAVVDKYPASKEADLASKKLATMK